MKMKKSIRLLFQLLILSLPGFSQESVLNRYISAGLKNNLALKQEQLNYKKSLEILNEAKGLFYPEISFDARYSVADGGRVIGIPVGDLMNPVYSTLNEILQQQRFPQITNENIPFLRPHEQETKIRLVQPVFNTSVHYNYQIKKDLLKADAVNIDIYKRYLVAEIKKAYYNYLKASKAVDLFNNTLPLVEENLRVNRSLLKNDKVTNDVVLRSEAEVSKVKQQIAEAVKQQSLARSYFNFLLNRPFSEFIELTEPFVAEFPEQNLDTVSKQAVSAREELERVDNYIYAAENSLKLNKGNFFPVITGVVDYGIEGEEYVFNTDNDFVMASLILKWNIFKGNQNKAKIQQAKLELEQLKEKSLEVQNQIRLEVVDAYYGLLSAREAIITAKDQQKSNSAAFSIVNKKYNNGQSNLLEFIDARTSMTNSEENLIIKKFDLLIIMAEFERVTAHFNFNSL